MRESSRHMMCLLLARATSGLDRICLQYLGQSHKLFVGGTNADFVDVSDANSPHDIICSGPSFA